MGCSLKAIDDDTDEYLSLCEKYKEPPEFDGHGPNCYSEHAAELKDRQRREWLSERHLGDLVGQKVPEPKPIKKPEATLPDPNTIEFFAVINEKGQWFRAKGYGGYGDTWTDKFVKARIYNRIGPARATISFFANNYSKFPAPKLVKLKCGGIEVIDESERVAKQKQKKLEAEARREERNRQWQLEQAQKDLENAKAKLAKLKAKKLI